MMYGYYPDVSLRSKIFLKPACKLISKITHTFDVEKDSPIGYNEIYVAMRNMKVATINIGYADGLRRALLNKGKVLILGNKCDIVGNICMDSCMVDITGIEGVEVGMDAVIFDYTNITVEQIASQYETINYEVLTNIGERVKREYINNL
jgi:alanine racemase